MYIDHRDKDTLRRVVTNWISELGEVETTLRGDNERLKGFLTAGSDHYRLPYDREDQVMARHTALCASCNSDAFLIDTTGNRRWYTLEITKVIPYAQIESFNADQLWAQVYAAVSQLPYDQLSQCFRLSAEDRKELDTRNRNYEKPIKAEEEIRDILAIAES